MSETKAKYISQMTVSELKNLLLGLGVGHTQETLFGLKKPRLIALAKEHKTPKRIEDVSVDLSPKPNTVTKTIPDSNSPEWTQYVLGLLSNDEMENQNPKVDGLRRVASFLIGPIIEEGSELVSPPSLDNGQRACVRSWVVFQSVQYNIPIRFDGLADVCSENCDDTFAKFPTSTAETRARGRCFRTALKLRKVIAAEEANFELPENGNDQELVIQVGQISVIQLMASRLNVSIPKLLKHLDLNKAELKELTKVEGLIVVKHLNALQSSGHIPEIIVR